MHLNSQFKSNMFSILILFFKSITKCYKQLKRIFLIFSAFLQMFVDILFLFLFAACHTKVCIFDSTSSFSLSQGKHLTDSWA